MFFGVTYLNWRHHYFRTHPYIYLFYFSNWGLQVKHLSVQQPPIKITLKALHVTPHKSYVTTDYKITPRATAQNTGR